MNKLLCTLCAALSLGIVLAGCSTGNSHSIPPEADVKTSSAPAPSATVHSGNSTNSASAPAVSSSAASRSASAEPEKENSLTGVINDVSMGQIYLLLNDGREIAFEFATADISKWTDSKPGANIIIYYKGTLNGTDTSGITVTRIENTK